MVTLNDALIDLVDANQVEPKEAYMKAIDKTNFATMLRTRNHDVKFLDMVEETSAKPGTKPAAAPPPKAAAKR
jgi:hypothetical protein